MVHVPCNIMIHSTSQKRLEESLEWIVQLGQCKRHGEKLLLLYIHSIVCLRQVLILMKSTKVQTLGVIFGGAWTR